MNQLHTTHNYFDCKYLLRFWLLVLGLCTIGVAQDKMMAVIDVQLQGDAKKYFSTEEREYLSRVIRGQASQVLGSSVEILSQTKFRKLVKANVDGCSEVGCFAGFIAEIGADLGMQPTISYAFGKLKMTLEVADNKATIGIRTLSAPATTEGKNLLGEQVESASAELFSEVLIRLGDLPGMVNLPTAQTTVGILQPLTVIFKDGPALVLNEQQLACNDRDSCRIMLSPGPHSLTFSRDGFWDSTVVVTMGDQPMEYSIQLEHKQVLEVLRVQDSQTGTSLSANVLINGIVVGVTPWKGSVNVIGQTIQVQMPGYERIPMTSRIEEGVAHVSTLFAHRMIPLDLGEDVWMPVGCFAMGRNGNAPEEAPVHNVCVHSFTLETKEVTQGQFMSIMKNNPSYFTYCGDNCPVERVTWQEANQYCQAIGKRLPTEAEWEYAALSDSIYKVNRMDSSYLGVHPVASGKANATGFFAMSDNVSEWVQDGFADNYYRESPRVDPTGPKDYSLQIYRGGSWNQSGDELSYHLRVPAPKTLRSITVGFRCAK